MNAANSPRRTPTTTFHSTLSNFTGAYSPRFLLVSNPSTCLNISESSLQLMTSIFAETQRHRLHHNRTPYRSNFLNEQKIQQLHRASSHFRQSTGIRCHGGVVSRACCSPSAPAISCIPPTPVERPSLYVSTTLLIAPYLTDIRRPRRKNHVDLTFRQLFRRRFHQLTIIAHNTHTNIVLPHVPTPYVRPRSIMIP